MKSLLINLGKLILLIILPPLAGIWIINLIISLIQPHLGEAYLIQNFHNYLITYLAWIAFSWPWLQQIITKIRQSYQKMLKLKSDNQSKHKEG